MKQKYTNENIVEKLKKKQERKEREKKEMKEQKNEKERKEEIWCKISLTQRKNTKKIMRVTKDKQTILTKKLARYRKSERITNRDREFVGSNWKCLFA